MWDIEILFFLTKSNKSSPSVDESGENDKKKIVAEQTARDVAPLLNKGLCLSNW